MRTPTVTTEAWSNLSTTAAITSHSTPTANSTHQYRAASETSRRNGSSSARRGRDVLIGLTAERLRGLLGAGTSFAPSVLLDEHVQRPLAPGERSSRVLGDCVTSNVSSRVAMAGFEARLSVTLTNGRRILAAAGPERSVIVPARPPQGRSYDGGPRQRAVASARPASALACERWRAAPRRARSDGRRIGRT